MKAPGAHLSLMVDLSARITRALKCNGNEKATHSMARVPPKLSELTTVFIDESSQTGHRYFALGGLVVNNTDVARLEQLIRSARLPDLPAAEMGWKKVSRAKLEAYRRVVDVFFDRRLETQPMHFHAVVIDCRKLKDKLFNDGSREVGFSKEMYQLGMKVARLYPARLHLYPDFRTTKTQPNELRQVLNFGIARKGDKRDWPFRRVHFRDSKDSLPLQLTDILLGALMFRINGHHQAPDASAAKLDLSAHVLTRAGVRDVMRDTEVAGRFTIWHRILR